MTGLTPLSLQVSVHGTLCPAEDITALESVHIAILLAGATFQNADLGAFIKQHKLERHFK